MIKTLAIKYIKKKFEQSDQTIEEREDIQTIKNIAYINDQDAYHLLDICYPKNADKPLPVLFNIHGGGWLAGDKDTNHHYASYLATLGYCVVNISYRLIPKTHLKGQIQDIFSAIQFIKNYESDIPWNKDEWFFIGDSAGGHLSALVYCILQDQDLQRLYEVDLTPFEVKGLILENMISDLSIMVDSKKYALKTLGKLLIGETKEIYHKSSFLEVINQNIKKVPIFLVSSEIDDLLPQTLKMQDYLKENNWTYDSIIWKKEDGEKLVHVFQVSHPYWKESIITHKRIKQFIDEVCL